jgi:hypothetical protein
MGDKAGVLRTLERSHNTARLTAEESPRSEILAEHAEATRIAILEVTELMAAFDRLLIVADDIGGKYVLGEGTGDEIEEWQAAIRACKELRRS